MADRRILGSLAALSALGKRLRARGKRIVFTNGCFDVLHVGHVRCLEGARGQGDVVVVGLNSDEGVRRIKGPGLPLQRERERAEILLSLRAVDHVYIFGERFPGRAILALRPHVFAKGRDYTADRLLEREALRKVGARFARVGDEKTHSTTDLLRKAARSGPVKK